MASIGGLSCTFLRGVVPALKEESAITRRPGIDGYEIHLTGKGDSQGELTAVLLSSNAGCNIWAAALAAMQGQIVTVVNDHGDTTTGVYVVQVGQPRKRAAVSAGGITQRAECMVQVLRVA